MRILLRAPTAPHEVEPPDAVIRRRLLATNSGNLVFLHASHRLLSTAQTEVTVDRLKIEPDEADRINASFDFYVVPLANAFRPTYEANLVRWTKLIERLRIPVVVLGVGAQSNLDYDLDPMRPLETSVKRFVAAVLDHGPSIGVRGEFSAHYLRSLGFRDVEVIGCPSVFIDGPALEVVKRVPQLDQSSAIVVNGSPDLPEIGRILERTATRFPRSTYVAQDADEVRWLTRGRRPLVPPSPGFPNGPMHPLVVSGRVRAFTHPRPWIRFLATQAFVFGARIHGNLTSLVAGTPSYVLVHDSRTLELARYFDIPHRPLAEVGDDIDPRRLYDDADYGALNAGHAARWATFSAYLAHHGLPNAFADGAPGVIEDGSDGLEIATIDGSSGVAAYRRRRTLRARIRRRLRRAGLVGPSRSAAVTRG